MTKSNKHTPSPRLAGELKQFQSALDKTLSPTVITDPNGIIIYANEAIEKLTGYSKQEIINQKIFSSRLWAGFMSPDYYSKVWHTIKKRKQPFVGEVTNKRKNNTRYIAELRIFPILDEDKNIIAFAHIEKDISQEKQLISSQADFISLASHQLKTPLTSISLGLDLLLHGSANKLTLEQKASLQQIYHQIHGMAGLIRTLLSNKNFVSGWNDLKSE